MAAALLLATVPEAPAAPSPIAGSDAPSTTVTGERVLRVAADPNNLPFSNSRGEGFENKIAELLARDLGARLEYTWHAQRRGFLRNTLKAGKCDLVLGAPSSLDMALTTRPYYRSTYVFVTRKDRNLHLQSLDDPALKQLKIGVQMIGDDGTNTPPAHALARRGLAGNVVGFTVYGDYNEDSPPLRILRAVVAGDIDAALVWGPQAGFFARRESTPLELTPIKPELDSPGLPFTFNISLAVRKGDKTFRDELDAVLAREQPQIESILDSYGVPRLEPRRTGGDNQEEDD